MKVIQARSKNPTDPTLIAMERRTVELLTAWTAHARGYPAYERPATEAEKGGAIAIGVAAVTHFLLMGSSYGAILRASGGNAAAVARAGWSLLRIKMALFALAGLFGALSGLALIGITTSGDANIGSGYTLLAIAGVILGGGEFVGGRVSPIGAVMGALTLTLASSSLLTFMQVPPDWQVAANGAILIIVLAARALINRRKA